MTEELQITIARGHDGRCRPKREDVGRIRTTRNGQQCARSTRRAVGWIVCMVRVRSGDLDVRPSVSTKLRFEHRTDGEEQLRRDE